MCGPHRPGRPTINFDQYRPIDVHCVLGLESNTALFLSLPTLFQLWLLEAPVSLRHTPSSCFLSISFYSGTCISLPSPGPHCFSKEPSFPLLENGVRDPDGRLGLGSCASTRVAFPDFRSKCVPLAAVEGTHWWWPERKWRFQ